MAIAAGSPVALRSGEEILHRTSAWIVGYSTLTVLPTPGYGMAYLTTERIIWVKGRWWLGGSLFTDLPKLIEIPISTMRSVSSKHSLWGSVLHLETSDRSLRFRLKDGIFLLSWPEKPLVEAWEATLSKLIQQSKAEV
jgi:hypothetical protein